MTFRKPILTFAAGVVPAAMLLSLAILLPAANAADGSPPLDCRGCHRVLPVAHPSVEGHRSDCMQCHAGHAMGAAVTPSPADNQHRRHTVWLTPRRIENLGVFLFLSGLLGPVVHGLLFLLSVGMRRPSVVDSEVPQLPPCSILLRCWHALNAISVMFLSASGFALRWLHAGSGMPAAARIVRWHSMVGGLYLLVWGGWMGLKLSSVGHARRYRRPAEGWVKGIEKQLAYYGWGIFWGAPRPHANEVFNPLQAAVYLLVMGVLLPGVLLTGLGLLSMRSAVMAALRPWRSLFLEGHYLLGCLLLGFFFMHLYLAIWGPGGRLWKRS